MNAALPDSVAYLLKRKPGSAETDILMDLDKAFTDMTALRTEAARYAMLRGNACDPGMLMARWPGASIVSGVLIGSAVPAAP